MVSELDAGSAVGEVYLRSLMRSQLRLAIALTVVLAATVGLLPLLFTLVEPLRTGEVGGVRIAWVLIGVCCYPVLIGLAVAFVRHADRNEQRFGDLVTPTSPTSPTPPASPGAPEWQDAPAGEDDT